MSVEQALIEDLRDTHWWHSDCALRMEAAAMIERVVEERDAAIRAVESAYRELHDLQEEFELLHNYVDYRNACDKDD